MTLKLVSTNKIGTILVLAIGLIAVSLVVLYTTRDATISTTTILEEWPIETSSTTGTILTSDCMQFLGDSKLTEGGTLEYSWMGTRDQYDQCWNNLIEKVAPVRYTPMIRVEAVGSASDALDSPFSDHCAPYWSEVSEAPDQSKVYAWTGTGLQHTACTLNTHVDQQRLEDLQSGNVMRPAPRVVIRPPE